jgi:hypothetical protein
VEGEKEDLDAPKEFPRSRAAAPEGAARRRYDGEAERQRYRGDRESPIQEPEPPAAKRGPSEPPAPPPKAPDAESAPLETIPELSEPPAAAEEKEAPGEAPKEAPPSRAEELLEEMKRQEARREAGARAPKVTPPDWSRFGLREVPEGESWLIPLERADRRSARGQRNSPAAEVKPEESWPGAEPEVK